VPVRLRHPEPIDGIALEIELNQNRGLVANDPPVMSRFDRHGLRGRKLGSAAIRILNMDLTAYQEPDVRVHADIGTDDCPHVRGPAESRWVDDALHAAAARPRHIDPGTADFAAMATGDRRE